MAYAGWSGGFGKRLHPHAHFARGGFILTHILDYVDNFCCSTQLPVKLGLIGLFNMLNIPRAFIGPESASVAPFENVHKIDDFRIFAHVFGLMEFTSSQIALGKYSE